MIFNFHLLVILLNEQQIRVKFLIILLKLIQPFLCLLILHLTPLKVLIQFRVGLLHLFDVLLILVELVHQSDVVELGQFSLEGLVEVLDEHSEAMENGAIADDVLDIIQNFHDEMIDLFLLVQTQRIGYILGLIYYAIFPFSLQASQLQVLMKCPWFVHSNFYYSKCINRQINIQFIFNRMNQYSHEHSIKEIDNISKLYDFDDILGQGTFACVWTVVKKQTGQVYAIKQVQVHPLEKDMAYKEVYSLEKVENDHIIKYQSAIYDTSENTLNLIMEKCAGSLRKQISERDFTEKELMSFIVQMNSAFLELLDKKLMHLDLKPQNILISKTNPNHYKICDFGCAQIAIKSKMTKYNDSTFGTFNYLAPENYLDYHGKITNTSADIWSLGVILYEMIYKKLPLELGPDGLIKRKAIKDFFEGKEDNIFYESLSNVSQNIITIIKKMLRPKPNSRITWPKLKEELQQSYSIDEYEFFNVKKIYFKHVKLINIFLTFVMIIRKNIDLNPHDFWRKDTKLLEEFSNTLLHLSYAYCTKFKDIYSFKMVECLEKEWVKNLDFMYKHIEYEQVTIANRFKYKLTQLSDLPYNEVLLLHSAQEIKNKLSTYTDFWETMYDLDLFCDQTIKRGQKKSFFASGDNQNYGETMKGLDIN